MSRRSGPAGAVIWLAAAAAVAATAVVEPIQVTPLVANGQVSASFAAPDAFGAEAHEVVQSGLLLTFTFTVELRRPSFLFDRTITSIAMASSAKFDNLTGAYQVSKLQDGRVFWSDRSQNETQVRGWMTTFDKVPLVPEEPLAANAEYYVRVRMQSSPKRTLTIWPFGGDAASGRAAFTFIQ